MFEEEKICKLRYPKYTDLQNGLGFACAFIEILWALNGHAGDSCTGSGMQPAYGDFAYA